MAHHEARLTDEARALTGARIRRGATPGPPATGVRHARDDQRAFRRRYGETSVADTAGSARVLPAVVEAARREQPRR